VLHGTWNIAGQRTLVTRKLQYLVAIFQATAARLPAEAAVKSVCPNPRIRRRCEPGSFESARPKLLYYIRKEALANALAFVRR
jgi:hypothetical protein